MYILIINFKADITIFDLNKIKSKATKDNPKVFFDLSILKLTNKSKIWRDKLFSKNFLVNKSKKDKINIYFAKANILHRESNFKKSAKYLQLANNLQKLIL